LNEVPPQAGRHIMPYQLQAAAKLAERLPAGRAARTSPPEQRQSDEQAFCCAIFGGLPNIKKF